MFTLKYGDIISKIKDATGKSEEEIEQLVKQKLTSLGDLVSKEGAAHIIANELKVKVIENIIGKLKIKQIVAGMNSVDILGKVIDIYPVRDFKTPKREGRVVTFLIGDETGAARVVVWDNNLIQQVEESLQKDKTIEIKNAYIKDNNGFKEIHLGNRSSFNFNCSEEITIGSTKEFKKIKELSHNDNVKVIGTIVQIFEPRFYEGCSNCRKKVELEDGNYKCPVHGVTNAREIPIINIFLDDGTESIRAVLFGDNVNKLVKDIKSDFESIKSESIGRQVEITGNVKKNEMFDRLEIFVNKIQDIDPEEMSKQILEEIKIG